MADEHYHELALPDGTIVNTGPPLGEPAMEEEAAPAMPPPPDVPVPNVPVPKGLKREYVRDETGRFATDGAGGAANTALEARTVALAVASAKAPAEAEAGRRRLGGLVDQAAARARETLGSSHPAVRELANLSGAARRADPRQLESIAHRLGRVNERLAAEAAAGKAAPATKEVTPVDERTAAATALALRSLDGLPAYGREVYDRMYTSTLSIFGKAGNPDSERYAQGIAWRGVAQAYDLQPAEPQAPAPAAPAKRIDLRAPAAQRTVQTKGIPPSVVTSSAGGTIIVGISRWRDADKWYDDIQEREIPDSGGAFVRVGLGRPGNHKNIIDVHIPKRVLDSMPGGVGAAQWVRNNWSLIFAIAKADIAPGGLIRRSIIKRFAEPPTVKLHVQCKFVHRPEEATDRITYDVVYAPWEVDLQGQYATETEVRKMAHEFNARKGGTNLMHITGLRMKDGAPSGHVVESFIARPGDPDFPRGSWVMGVRWHPEAWEQIKAGTLRGYSIEGQWGVVPLHLVPSPQEVA